MDVTNNLEKASVAVDVYPTRPRIYMDTRSSQPSLDHTNLSQG